MKKEVKQNGTIVLVADGGWIVNEDHSVCTNYQVWLSKFDSEENYKEITNEEKEQWDREHQPEEPEVTEAEVVE